MKWQDQLKESFNAAKEKAAASIEKIDQQITSSIQNEFRPPTTNERLKSSGSSLFGGKEEPAATSFAKSAACSFPNSVESVVEDLRMQFFKACQVDQPQRAFQLYTMTLDEYVAEKQRETEERSSSSNDNIEKIKDNLSKEWNIFKSSIATTFTKEPTAKLDEHNYKPAKIGIATVTGISGNMGVLEQHMHPNQFFPPSYFHAYLMPAGNAMHNTMNKLKQQIRAAAPRQTLEIKPAHSERQLRPRAPLVSNAGSDRAIQTSSSHSNTSSTHSTNAASLLAPTTTTPLHEAARMGYAPLLKRMMDQPALDLSQQDWKQRTVLHYLCGGVCSSEEEELSRETLSTSYRGGAVTVLDDNNPIKPGVLAQPDGGMKSFFFSTLEKKRQRELEKREKMRQVVQNIKAKVTIPVIDDPNIAIWSKFVDSTKSQNDNPQSKAQPPNPPMPTHKRKYPDDSGRLDCLKLILNSYPHNPVGINTVDCRVRTALHYASSLGRLDLVRELVKLAGLLVTIVDEEGHTACEVASDGISQGMLEALAVFDLADAHQSQEEMAGEMSTLPWAWFETWDEAQVKVEMDKRIKAASNEVQQYLRISYPEISTFQLSDAQVVTLLESSKWDIHELMMRVRMSEQEAALEPGVQNSQFTQENQLYHTIEPPLNPILFAPPLISLATCDESIRIKVFGEKSTKDKQVEEEDELTCLICYSVPDDPSDWISFKDTCGHGFCKECVAEYIRTCYVDPRNRTVKPTTRIPCPHFECGMLLPLSILSLLLSPQDHETLCKGELELFVLSTNFLRFCPIPACTGIVHADPPTSVVERFDNRCTDYLGAVCTACCKDSDQNEPPVPEHRFCFSCGGSPHFPVSCEDMERWRDTVAAEMKDIVSPSEDSKENFEDVAHRLWIKANTRPCPKVRTFVNSVRGII